MQLFVYAPASMHGNWTNVSFFKFLQLYYQTYLKSINGASCIRSYKHACYLDKRFLL